MNKTNEAPNLKCQNFRSGARGLSIRLDRARLCDVSSWAVLTLLSFRWKDDSEVPLDTKL